MLEITKLSKHFGGLMAVRDLDISVNRGDITGLIGPNGAGKTTVFNLITGFIKPSKGNIVFEKSTITGLSPHIVSKSGIVRTFQDESFLSDLTVMQNIIVAQYLHPKTGFLEALFNSTGYRRKETYALRRALEILEFLGLEYFKNELAQNLPHGYQRLLGIAIALSANPKLLLLDEPLAGMNASEVKQALELIRKIRASGTTILIIEHNMTAVMQLCEHIVVLNFGQKIAEGSPEEVSKNSEVIEAYLGVKKNVAQIK